MFKNGHPCKKCIWKWEFKSNQTKNGKLDWCWIHNYPNECLALDDFLKKQKKRYMKHFNKKRA